MWFKLHAERAGCILGQLPGIGEGWVRAIPEHCAARQPGNNLLENLQALGAECGGLSRAARDIATSDWQGSPPGRFRRD